MFACDEIAALGLMRYINSLIGTYVHMCFRMFWDLLCVCEFPCVSLCMLGVKQLFVCVSLYSLLHYRHLHSLPTYHIETFPNSESLILYLGFNRMSIDCMFEVQNLIWQAKRQKSEAGRSCMKLQI